jgi:hypothetical protein
METILEFLRSDSLSADLVLAGALGAAVGLARVTLREMYASRRWRLQPHWD